VSEFIADGREGLLAEDDAGLARALLRLCSDDGLRNRIADHNRSTPVKFTWDHALAVHLETYHRARALLEKRAVGSARTLLA
jgi:glycosyltransferase involved in cell wall biosynthesis